MVGHQRHRWNSGKFTFQVYVSCLTDITASSLSQLHQETYSYHSVKYKEYEKPSQRHSCTKVFYHAIVVFSGNPCQVLNLQYLFHSFSTEQEKGSEKENQFATVSCLSSRWRCYWCQGNVIVLVTLKSSSSF